MPDSNPPAGATPAAADATSTQSTPAGPAAAATDSTATPPATDGTDALGDAGKKALDAMKAERNAARDAQKAAEARADAAELATKSDTERAIALAKTEGTAAATAKYEAAIRRSEVRAALTAAGINGAVLDLAVRADEFAALTVSDEGEVEGLAAAIKAFKDTRADLFTKPVTPGSADGGTRGKTKLSAAEIREIAKDPAEYEKRREEILASMG